MCIHANLMTMKIYPDTSETQATYQQMMFAVNADPRIVEMNDTTVQDIKVIWESIEALAPQWRGREECHIPGKPMNRQEYWGDFASHRCCSQFVLQKFLLETEGEGKIAIDFGCGNSFTVALLMHKGWKVIAIDNSKLALKHLTARNQEYVQSGQLEVICEDIATYVPKEPVDLVIATDVLPYIDPVQFKTTWMKIHDVCVKEGGFFIGTLFRSVDSPTKLQSRHANNMKEMGAWLLPDKRMVSPLLTGVGYDIKECVCFEKMSDHPGMQGFKGLENLKDIIIQFVAQKKFATVDMVRENYPDWRVLTSAILDHWTAHTS